MDSTHYEAVKARALAALQADELPTDKWALKNRVAVAVIKAGADMLTDYMAKEHLQKATTSRPRIGKGEKVKLTREILKSIIGGATNAAN